MISKDLIAAPLFSLAILRDVSGDAGYLALGGVPPVSFTQDFTSTPILVTTISGYPDTYDFYTINIDEVVLNGAAVTGSGGTGIQYIVSCSISVCLVSLIITALTILTRSTPEQPLTTSLPVLQTLSTKPSRQRQPIVMRTELILSLAQPRLPNSRSQSGAQLSPLTPWI